MIAVYSFVVDADPRFVAQTRLFLASLMAQGVPAEAIHAHVTPETGETARDLLRETGVHTHVLHPFLDGKYCNKLVQLDALLAVEADCYVLCDTDLAFAGPITEWLDAERLRAKPVDLPNPPLDRLEALRNRFGLAIEPRLVRTSADAALTWSTNCNGGLYIVPRRLAAPLAAHWQQFAVRLRGCEDILENWYHHVDQIAFAMAVLAMGRDVLELPLEANFPMHLGDRFDHMTFGEPTVLHYHSLLDAAGRVQLTGHPVVDAAIAKANASLEPAPATAPPAGVKASPAPKVVVGTGWWCAPGDNNWLIGSPRTKTAAFFEIWYRQVHRCLAPQSIVLTDSASPVPPPLAGKADVLHIPLDRNYGHANDIRTGRIATQFCGFTRSVIVGAMIALACDADVYVYVEQDCLLVGEDFLAAATDGVDADILLGVPTEGGRGLDGGAAAPMLQQSLMVVRRSALPRFIDALASAPWTDGEVSPEETMRLRLPPFGLLAVPYGRSRPIDPLRSHFYAQHLTDAELDEVLRREGFAAALT